ncbi:Inhibitor of growth protein 3 [Madurella mycetomatis]|uniref:Inhibitor of growth protein 3 n=1 Tax=Madurella mycetomatis TaxID=100816 RepID=A0A175VZP3_9PEZI|nr:Inhibitor of growth protein 3 [Madurella mycetomatis]
MASAEIVRPDMDEAISPRQTAPSIEQTIQSIGSINPPINSLDMRADPDAQATVSDFLDFTEYLPADMTRSLTLIGKLDQTYVDASAKVHELTTLWGRLPNLPAAERTGPVELRAQISENLQQALNSRVYSLAEAQRMAENVNRHYTRAKTILTKLETMLENYPTAEEQKSPVTTKSPQVSRAPKITLRVDGQKPRRPAVPRITVPGEVLAPYELNYDAYMTGTDSSSDEEDDDDEGLSSRLTPAPQARIKVVKVSRTPKLGRGPRPRTSVPPPNLPGAGLSTSAAMAQLAPPPENAVIGSSDAPWGQLTPYELARLRKRMKKNAAWTPSDTMVARELSALGRGVEAFKAAKQKAEEEGRVFEGKMPVPTLDPDTGEKRMPLGALTLEALTSDEKNLSNRGMKLNEAKKLKRELLAKMAAEEAEESARRFDAIAKTLMSDAPPPNVQDQSAKAAGKAKSQKKRKRDSVPDAEAEKPEGTTTQPQRPQFKRTKTETPVPPPLLTPGASQGPSQETPGSHPQRASTAGIIHSTTPIPLPIHSQDQSITAKSATSVASATSPASSITGAGNNLAPVKPPATETPIPPPVLSPKKSMTPILPPARETRMSQAARTQQQQTTATAATAVLPSRSASPDITPKPDPDAPSTSTVAATTAPSTTAPPSTTTTTVTTRRPASRGKATSQEPPQPSLAADRPRRASTARNTPAPERAATMGMTEGSSATGTASSPLAATGAVSAAAQGAATITAGTAGAAGGGGGGVAAAAAAAAAAARPPSKRTKRPAPGIISRTNSGGNSAVGMRKAAPRKKRAGQGAAGDVLEVEVDDEGNVIDPDEPRYCLCNRVSFGTMIQCDNVDNCKQEWFHLECVGLSDIPARTTKWYCPDCRVLLNIGEKGEVSARGVKA